MLLRSINYFRGIAIIAIVAGHCFAVSGWQISSIFEKTVANLIIGGTALFVFISGYLFHHVFYRRFEFTHFVKKKIQSVLLPYLLLSLLTISFYLYSHTGYHAHYFFAGGDGLFYDYIRPLFLYLLTGGVNMAYWYIPFIMVMFLMSPLFIMYIRFEVRTQIIIAVGLLLLAMLIHRPVDNLSVFQSVVYFTPVYLFGILTSLYRHQIDAALRNKTNYLLLGCISLAFIQALLFDHYGNFHKFPFELGSLDIIILQKLLMCFFLISYLSRFEHTSIPPLEKLAQLSFPIYFLHPYIMDAMSAVSVSSLLFSSFNLPGPVRWLIVTSLILTSCAVLTTLIKKSMPRHSRAVIGL